MKARKLAIRFTAIAFFQHFCLPHYPLEFVLRMIAKGLEDVSPKVRIFAAVTGWTWFLRDRRREERLESCCLLIDRLKLEEDAEVKYNLLFALLRIGRDRFEVREAAEGKVSLHALSTENGKGDSLVCDVHLSQGYIESLRTA